MKTMDLVMVIHCHQPVGNFHHVFDKGHKKCYRPLLDLLETHPKVKVGLHFSGPLLEWLEKYRPGTLELLSGLVARGQVELLSGGFFEPLLAAIPVRDAQGQVLMMNEYLEKNFDFKPAGFWLTERVWDPALPLTLKGTGMTYTVVDDTHFYYAGLKPDQIFGRYVTEKEGHTLSLLATPMIMRYLIPFRPVEDVMGHLRDMEVKGRGVALYGDDGEKFGLWPGTYEWVIENGWLEKFLSSISESTEWLRTVLPGEYATSSPSLGRIYLPQASYEEMTEWALPPERGRFLEDIITSLKEQGRWEEWRPFVRGGVWDNFLVKYDEANRMHKKMLLLSERAVGDKRARDRLWRAQCNCAYWHGVFGGLYLGHLRRAVHENLIRCQASLMENSGRAFELLQFDFDRDGAEEILIRAPSLSLGLEPNRGGGMFDLCHLPLALNLSDTLTRRPEAYHRQLKKTNYNVDAHTEGVASIHDLTGTGEGDLEQFLIFDPYTRASLLDHFLGYEVTPEDYAANEYIEFGDFVQGEYRVERADVSSNCILVEMSRIGEVKGLSLGIHKKIAVEEKARMVVDYLFESRCSEPISARYGCEFNLTLFSDKDKERYFRIPGSGARRGVSETGAENEIRKFDVVNAPEHLCARFFFSEPVSAWFFPLMTVSKSEEGFECSYQGSSFLFLFPLRLSAGKKARLQIELELIDLR